jgi:hypothetical protein
MSSNAGAVNHVARKGDTNMTPGAAAPQRAATSGIHLDGSGILPLCIEVPHRQRSTISKRDSLTADGPNNRPAKDLVIPSIPGHGFSRPRRSLRNAALAFVGHIPPARQAIARSLAELDNR